MPACADTQHRIGDFGGADRDRTGGLLVANQALSQLSYSPNAVSRLTLPGSEQAVEFRAAGLETQKTRDSKPDLGGPG